MWGTTSAAILAGLPLAYLLSAIFAALLPTDFLTKTSVVMHIGLTIYSVIIFAAYAANNGKQAWLAMMSANGIAAVALWGCYQLGWYGVPEVLRAL